MMNKKAWVLTILAIFCLSACATTESARKAPPLPNDISIIPPAAGLAKELAVFSGKWTGTWNYGMDSILIVEEIGSSWAKVVYSIGDVPRFNVSAKYFRFTCKVTPGPNPKLEWMPPTAMGGITSFEAIDSDTLEGSQSMRTQGNEVINRVTMKRTN